jgi:hypothetical protein
MKIKVFSLIILSAILIPVLVLAETATVITKENAIREYCKFFAPVKAHMKYNDSLEILSPEGDWFKVKFKSVVGCIHKSAVEKKTVSIWGSTQPSKGPGVSESEATLAGKGFNPQVESSYKKKHPEMKYNLVDNIEKSEISDKDLARFVVNGGLKQP